MHFAPLFALPFFLTAVLAVPPKDTTKTFTSTSCLTQLGSTSIKNVPTSRSTKTQTLPCLTKTFTSRPTVKVTPTKTITTTKCTTTKVTKTLSKSTGVITTTHLVTRTVTSTDVVTSTNTVFTETTKIETSTSTVPTVAGFRPISDTTARPVAKRAEEIRQYAANSLAERGTSKKNTGLDCKKYPKSVQCTKVVQVRVIKTKVVTGRALTVTAPRRVVFRTNTKAYTITKTQPFGEATSTVTITSTITSTAVETSTVATVTTSTTTVTSTSVVTAYAACSTSNMLSSHNGQGISNAFNNGPGVDSTYTIITASSAQECCALCQQSTTCQGSAFEPGRCGLLYSRAGVCNAGAAAGYFTSGESIYTMGNGPCGYFYAGP